MARRGNRKNGLREKNGRLQRIHEEIIPEGLAIRRMVAIEGGYSRDRRGNLERTGAVREQKASTPLGMCRARGLILEIEHQAGEKFEQLHRRQVERARTPKSPLANLLPSGEGSIAVPTDADDDARDQAAYLNSRMAVKKTAGSRAFSLLIDVVIHHHWPRLLDSARRRPAAAWVADARDLEALRAALSALVHAMDLRPERGDDFGLLLRSLEEQLDRRPTANEVATALLYDSVASLFLRREQRLKRETA
jgi:hypothetical protein